MLVQRASIASHEVLASRGVTDAGCNIILLTSQLTHVALATWSAAVMCCLRLLLGPTQDPVLARQLLPTTPDCGVMYHTTQVRGVSQDAGHAANWFLLLVEGTVQQ